MTRRTKKSQKKSERGSSTITVSDEVIEPPDSDLEEPPQEPEVPSGAQAGEGYACTCGFMTSDKNKFRKHFLEEGKAEPGKHRSRGRINLQTGEIVLPPWEERTKEQKAQSLFGKKDRGNGHKDVEAVKQTDVMADAQLIRFVPRVYTVNYTPIMRLAQEAAVREWGWRRDMPLENFLDTCLHLLFKSADPPIFLNGYVVGDGKQQQEVLNGG